MPNWEQLISKSEQVVQAAQDYLEKRRYSPAVPEPERQLLESLARELGESAANVRAIEPRSVTLQDSTWKILSEQLDLADRHIQELHEYYDYASVESVVGALNHSLQVMAGPHGPGQGRPGSEPRRRTGSG